MHSAPTLFVDALAVVRGDLCLFRNFSAQIAAGEVVHLVGRNGAGKTSLLETLCGLRRPESGEVRGLDPSDLHWLGHKNALHPALSPVENLQFWCGSQGLSTEAIPAALDTLQVKAARHRATRTLSTGQKRRTALARLLLQPRPWWLLDEPLAGLDVEGVALFASLVARHRQNGGALLLTSHQALPEQCGSVRRLVLAP